MSKILFSSWQGKRVDNRGVEAAKHKAATNLEIPTQYNGKEAKAFIGWDGVAVFDDSVNMAEIAHAYLSEAQKISCGECSAGYFGLRAMLGVLTRIISGQGKEDDIELLKGLAQGIIREAKCIFGESWPVPILDTLEHFKGDYLKLIKSGGSGSQTGYITKITAPCTAACPAQQDVPGYIDQIQNLRYEDSLKIIRQTNPLPGFCGRACVAFCEEACTRGSIDTPLAIRALKRFAADREQTSQATHPIAKAGGKKEKVAVIGAGPAGLAASYSLAQKGYPVTVYDEQPAAGGMALAGIPTYRLPREVINYEAQLMEKQGVKFQFNTKVGKDITLDKFTSEGYKAIFVATGAHLGREMGLETSEAKGEGVIDGVEFLQQVNAGKKVAPRNKVIVIGGGNVAIDCARTCLRLGFKEVTIVYRRSRTEMPGQKEEIEAAEKEGVKITFLATPVKILSQNGQVTGAECVRMELGEPDASGRRRPIPVAGSEFTIKTDMVIPAVGEQPDLSFLAGQQAIKLTEQGTIAVDANSGQTGQPAIFSGGDCVTGPATIIEAIAAGNRAAASIDQYLSTGKVGADGEQVLADTSRKLDLVQQREISPVIRKPRQSPQQLPVAQRTQNFNEVENVFTPQEAFAEAERCLRCYRILLIAT